MIYTFFCVNFVTSKRRSQKSFDKYHVWFLRPQSSGNIKLWKKPDIQLCNALHKKRMLENWLHFHLLFTLVYGPRISQPHLQLHQRLGLQHSVIRLGRSHSFDVVASHILSSLRDHSYPDHGALCFRSSSVCTQATWVCEAGGGELTPRPLSLLTMSGWEVHMRFKWQWW